MKLKKQLCILLACITCLTFMVSGCGDTTINVGSSEQNEENPTIELLTTGWVNTPTDENDPYKAWILENYGLNVNLTATSDFSNQVLIKFASDNQPDIVSFSSVNDFLKIYNQESLLLDWTPYLDKMPNVKAVIEADETTKQMFTRDGKIIALWTQADPPTWSLKVRADWLENLGLKAPRTPEELLNVARAFRNNDPDGNGIKDTYAFTSAGNGADFGTLGQWIALMYGRVSIAPYGFFVEDNEVQYELFTGNHKKMLDFIKTIVEEDLIDPSWYIQSWDQKKLTHAGKVGFEWYPGVISQEAEQNNEKQDGSTLGWWETIDVPKDPDSERGGLLPEIGGAGHIITVSAKTALDSNKMDKICAFLNDIVIPPSGDRPVAYDALRWGVGIEEGVQYVNIEGSDLSYCNTGDEKQLKTYRGSVPGAWDWGAWFSTTGDKVVQGSSNDISDIILKVVEHDAKTAEMATYSQIGELLTLDATLVGKVTRLTNEFEYKYVTGKITDYDSFVEEWKEIGGDQLMEEAEKQFKEYGLIK